MDNHSWAHAIIDQLVLQNVCDFCIAPGSRSTPLALAAARHPKAAVHVHFDERGVGFFGLGLSLATRLPAAIIVTSGTAVGNLLPAVMESSLSRVPLILLTADRPHELQDCGANQTVDQIGLFESFAIWQTDLPCPEPHLAEEFARSQMSYAVFQAQQGGPVHINCRFREPLFTPPASNRFGSSQSIFFPILQPSSSCTEFSETVLSQAKRGIILIGRMPPFSNLEPIISLAKQLCWPIFADILSQMRCTNAPYESIRHFDDAIGANAGLKPDLIVHFGGPFVSPTLQRWIKREEISLMHISNDPQRIDPLHRLPIRIWADPALFCQSISTCFTEKEWLESWKCIDREMASRFDVHFASPHPFTEADLMRHLQERMPSDWTIFLANSMPIRDADRFFFPKSVAAIFANRGASGIDGQIATAAGIASKLKRPMLAILGDQSCLYDLNSLPLLRAIKTPFLLLISNNFGGGIFSHLPIAQDPAHCETLFSASHHFCFQGAADMFGIPYQSSLNAEVDFFNISAPSIIEVLTSRKDSAIFRNQCSATPYARSSP